MSDIMLIVHVATAVFIVGPMAILPMVALKALRGGSFRQVRSFATSTLVIGLLSLVTLVAGFGLQGMYKIPFGRTWIWLSVVLYLLAFVLTVLVVVPALRRAARQLQAVTDSAGQVQESTHDHSASSPSAPMAGYGLIAGSSGLASLLLIAVVVLMIVKV